MDCSNRFDIDLLPDYGTAVALPGASAQAEIGGMASSDSEIIVAIVAYGISDA